MGIYYEATDPVMTMDISGQCQVAVISTTSGTILRFDGPNGEIEFRIKDDEWLKIQDAVYLAKTNRGLFDRSQDDDD